jgi:radical SAM protein with 4Fe4S-binding SPASM domain
MDTPEAPEDRAYLEWGVGCQACRFWLGIDHNGDVWPCFRTPLKLGNLLEQSLDEIEATELFTKIRDRTGKKGKCATCKHLPLCGGGCLSDCMGLTGDPFAAYPLCWYDPATDKEECELARAQEGT